MAKQKRGRGEIGVSLRSYDSAEVSRATGRDTGKETLTQQHFAEEVDVNNIVRRYGLTREMPSGPAGGVYGDFTGIADYQDAVERVAAAQRGFEALPPDVRERFNNDPGRLIAYVQSVPEDDLRIWSPETPFPGGVEPPPVSDS